MGKKYTNTKTGLTIVSGPIKEIGEDRKTAVIEVQSWDVKEQKRVSEDVKIASEYTIEENIGDIITAYGYNIRGVVQVDRFTKDNMYSEVEPAVDTARGVAILAGDVLFAGKNDEIDSETGEPRLNKAGKAKKPHFDISISVGEGENRVLHTVNIYNLPERTDKEGKVIPAQDNISKYEKLFNGFMTDKKQHPMYVSIRTQPGDIYTKDVPAVYKEGSLKGQPILDKTTGQPIVWHNKRMSHLGANSIDITYLPAIKEQTNENVAPATQAPQIEQETIEKEDNSGFNAGAFSMEGMGDFLEFPEMEDFSID